MKVMMIVRANQDSEAGKLPPPEVFTEMAKYNEELSKAGVLLDLAGLRPGKDGAVVRFSPGQKRTVIDGPFAEAKELIAGFWILQVKSLQEAIEWAKRVPNPEDVESAIELRPIFEMEDVPR